MRTKLKIAAALIGGLIATRAGQLALHAQSSDTRSVWDGVYMDDQSKRGGALYQQECARCHGDTLSGGEMAPALVGEDFLADWYGSTVGDLFDRIRKSMPADGPGTLSREKTADILSYLLRMNQFPAGKTELAARKEILDQIRIEPAKAK